MNPSLEIFVTQDEFVQNAIRQNRPDLVQYAINRGFNNWNIVLKEAAAKGNLEMVDFYLRLSSDYQAALDGALRGHQITLFNKILTITPTWYGFNWNNLLENAIQSGDKFLYDYIQSLVPSDYILDWTILIKSALESGNKEIFNSILYSLPNDYPFNWNNLVAYASKSGNKNLLDYVRSLVPKYN